MKRLVAVAFATSLAAAPAVRAESPPDGASGGGSIPVEPGRGAAAPDDTGRNVRDRGGELPTPLDQSNAKADLEITQAIRKAILADDGLSMNARNVKVITADGIVTLRGPVESQAERARIESIARGLSQVRRVDSLLEVDDAGARP